MGNHQIELAEKLADGGHLEFCTPKNLVETLRNFDALKLKPFPKSDPEFFGRLVTREIEDHFGLCGEKTGKENNTKDSKVLAKSVTSAKFAIASSILLRLMTFVINAVILRFVTREILGINVRLTLLYDTILFLCREAFRKACLNQSSQDKWRGVVNLIWLGVPAAAVLSPVLGYLWLTYLESPPEELLSQYRSAVPLTCLATLPVLMSETFYVVGQTNLLVEFKSLVDLIYLTLPPLAQMEIVLRSPENFILHSAYFNVFNGWLFFTINFCYFRLKIKKGKVSGFSSVRDFFPCFSSMVDRDRLALSVSFFKQGFLKQLLTEGEKYMITWFNLMSLSQQGVFDVIGNLGSIPARLFFSKIEESAHLYFSQTTRRGQPWTLSEKEASENLKKLNRIMILIGKKDQMIQVIMITKILSIFRHCGSDVRHILLEFAPRYLRR